MPPLRGWYEITFASFNRNITPSGFNLLLILVHILATTIDSPTQSTVAKPEGWNFIDRSTEAKQILKGVKSQTQSTFLTPKG